MSELVDQLRGGALQEEMRTLHADLATARQALLDMNVAKAQQDKALVELQKRNKFLERHARIPTTLDKCVGTDPPPAVDTWVQVPHGIELYQARAFVPEGAAGSSLYTHGEGAGHGHTARAAVEASYTLQAQRTMAQGAGGSFSGSDMRLASGPQVRGHGMPPTGESVQGQQAGRRRMSAPPAPLLGPDGMPRQIQFYSTSGPSAPLPPVAEHGEEEEHVVAAVPAAEAELLAACGMVGTVAGSTARYTHAGTGFCFEVRPAPPDSEADAEGGEKHDWHYHLVNLGAAEPVLQQVPTLGPYLTSDFAFGAAMREFLVRSIAEGLAAAGYR